MLAGRRDWADNQDGDAVVVGHGLDSEPRSSLNLASGELLTLAQVDGRQRQMNQGGGSLPRPPLITNSLLNEDSRADLRASEQSLQPSGLLTARNIKTNAASRRALQAHGGKCPETAMNNLILRGYGNHAEAGQIERKSQQKFTKMKRTANRAGRQP